MQRSRKIQPVVRGKSVYMQQDIKHKKYLKENYPMNGDIYHVLEQK